MKHGEQIFFNIESANVSSKTINKFRIQCKYQTIIEKLSRAFDKQHAHFMYISVFFHSNTQSHT